MATETRIGRALLGMPVLLGITALSLVLALAVACGGEEQSQGGPAITPSPSAPETGTPGGTPTVAQPTATAQPTPTAPTVVEVSVDDDPSWGPEDAPVTIIEFSEFLCPYCQRFAVQTLPQIKQAYEGEVRYVYRDFIVHGEPALKISEATECADDQEKFWEYHDKLWESYQANAQQAQAGTDALVTALEGYASDLGLDTAKFNDCLDSDKYASEVQKDSQDAQSYGVGGTPSFFVNGQLVVGAVPFEDYQDSSGGTQPGFKTIIDQALAAGEGGAAVPTVPSGAGG